jgi:hypothetical protein
MIYIKTLELVDEDDVIIHRVKHKPAYLALCGALQLVRLKGGVKQKLTEIDNELKEYFDFG